MTLAYKPGQKKNGKFLNASYLWRKECSPYKQRASNALYDRLKNQGIVNILVQIRFQLNVQKELETSTKHCRKRQLKVVFQMLQNTQIYRLKVLL